MNYLKSPIIIKGVNHSGTGVLVEILKILGSDAGDINNKWKENKFFLEIHKSLISKISKNSSNEFRSRDLKTLQKIYPEIKYLIKMYRRLIMNNY